MIGTTNYRRDDSTSEVEQKSLTLVRVKVEDPAKSFSNTPATIDHPDHPRGFIVSD